MPRLWDDTIDEHRHAVRQAIMDAAATLVGEHGLAAVTMSGIAERTGIGRATLYKYFPDIESILVAWHEAQVQRHLAHLGNIADRPGSARERLEAVLAAFAAIAREHGGTDLTGLLHGPDGLANVSIATSHLTDLVAGLIAEGATAGIFRTDVQASELAAFSLHALTASRTTATKAATARLVAITLDALRC